MKKIALSLNKQESENSNTTKKEEIRVWLSEFDG